MWKMTEKGNGISRGLELEKYRMCLGNDKKNNLRISFPSSSGGETQEDPEGPSWGPNPFSVPRFLFLGKRLQPLRPSLGSKGQMQTVTN